MTQIAAANLPNAAEASLRPQSAFSCLLRTRLAAVYAVLTVMNLGAWIWAFTAFGGKPALLGVALVVYGLGVRHAVDADHIAAIDNVTRKLMQSGARPVGVGFFFAIGHSMVIVAVTTAIAKAAGIGAVSLRRRRHESDHLRFSVSKIQTDPLGRGRYGGRS